LKTTQPPFAFGYTPRMNAFPIYRFRGNGSPLRIQHWMQHPDVSLKPVFSDVWYLLSCWHC